MATIKQLIKYIDDEFNFDNQEVWDHCGFNNVFNIDNEITSILICLDLTENIIKHCINNNINTIISHHPLYVGEMSELSEYQVNRIMNLQKMMAENNLFHIVLHTCFDMHKKGTSYQLFKRLFKTFDIECHPIKDSKYSIYFSLDSKIPLKMFIQLIRNKQFCTKISANKNALENEIKNVAICAGSGIGEIDKILNNDEHIDCFLTGDIKWHNYIDYNNINLVDIGHDVERVFIDTMYEFLSSYDMDNVEIFKYPVDTIINFVEPVNNI